MAKRPPMTQSAPANLLPPLCLSVSLMLPPPSIPANTHFLIPHFNVRNVDSPSLPLFHPFSGVDCVEWATPLTILPIISHSSIRYYKPNSRNPQKTLSIIPSKSTLSP
ncbi:hypothetical protein Ancab_032421 [Ancistrocladus abbreviatus]